MTGSSVAIGQLRDRIVEVAGAAPDPALFYGEPGSGKLRAALATHCASSRHARACVVVDARTLSDGTLRWFGDWFEHAPQRLGCVIVRHVAQCPRPLHAELGRILAGLTTLHADAPRVLLTSGEGLRASRLGTALETCVVAASHHVLRVPPLRERGTDTEELARIFVQEARERGDTTVQGISVPALALLRKHPFPGNVGELRRLITVAALQCRSHWLTGDVLPPLAHATAQRTERGVDLTLAIPGHTLREVEGRALMAALEAADGRLVRAAESLGITRHAMRRRLAKHGLRGPWSTEDDEPDVDA